MVINFYCMEINKNNILTFLISSCRTNILEKSKQFLKKYKICKLLTVNIILLKTTICNFNNRLSFLNTTKIFKYGKCCNKVTQKPS